MSNFPFDCFPRVGPFLFLRHESLPKHNKSCASNQITEDWLLYSIVISLRVNIHGRAIKYNTLGRVWKVGRKFRACLLEWKATSVLLFFFTWWMTVIYISKQISRLIHCAIVELSYVSAAAQKCIARLLLGRMRWQILQENYFRCFWGWQNRNFKYSITWLFLLGVSECID